MKLHAFVHMCDMTYSFVWHDAFMCVTWRFHVCAMASSYVWCDSLISVWRHIHIWKRLMHMCVKKNQRHGPGVIWSLAHSCIRRRVTITHPHGVTWLVHVCDMPHSSVWRDWFVRVTWRIHMWDMSHSYAWYNSFICVIWLIHIRDTTYSHM